MAHVLLNMGPRPAIHRRTRSRVPRKAAARTKWLPQPIHVVGHFRCNGPAYWASVPSTTVSGHASMRSTVGAVRQQSYVDVKRAGHRACGVEDVSENVSRKSIFNGPERVFSQVCICFNMHPQVPRTTWQRLLVGSGASTIFLGGAEKSR